MRNWNKWFNQPPKEVNKLLLEKIILGEAKYEPLFIIPEMDSDGKHYPWFLYLNFQRFGSFLYEKGIGCHNLKIFDNGNFQYSFSLNRYVPSQPSEKDIILTTAISLEFIKDKLKYRIEETKKN